MYTIPGNKKMNTTENILIDHKSHQETQLLELLNSILLHMTLHET